MSARLTLLFLCDQIDTYSLFASALLAAGFHVLIEHTAEGAKRRLAHATADLVMIRHHDMSADSQLGVELKLLAPRTPIVLLAAESQPASPHPGVDSVCHADTRDAVLAQAVAMFFRNTVAKLLPQPSSYPREREAALVSSRERRVVA